MDPHYFVDNADDEDVERWKRDPEIAAVRGFLMVRAALLLVEKADPYYYHAFFGMVLFKTMVEIRAYERETGLTSKLLNPLFDKCMVDQEAPHYVVATSLMSHDPGLKATSVAWSMIASALRMWRDYTGEDFLRNANSVTQFVCGPELDRAETFPKKLIRAIS